jgi:hypothetical protein
MAKESRKFVIMVSCSFILNKVSYLNGPVLNFVAVESHLVLARFCVTCRGKEIWPGHAA